LWTAYREGALQTSPAPWLGYLFLLEDCPESHAPVRVREPHFPVFPEFQGSSYARRYEIFCRKLVLERRYNGACFLMSSRDKAEATPNYTEPADDVSGKVFLTQLVGHLRTSLAGL
ncbi:MAG: PaeR7I family type II restriction endonuclease, partial [Haloechinothrix sp.]